MPRMHIFRSRPVRTSQRQSGKRRFVDERTMHQDRVADPTARRFQMQAALHDHRTHVVAMRLHFRSQLADARRIAPCRHADE